MKTDEITDIFSNLKHIPRSPGVYFFKNAKGEILYIGKAKDLRKRISQYKQGQMASPQTEIMLSQAAKIDFLVASSEVESLIWENNLIKGHQPKYNIRLRDDKDYLYIKISNGPFPKIETAHRPDSTGGLFIPHLSQKNISTKDKAKMKSAGFIGPFTSSEYVHTTLKTIRKIFPYRTCNVLPKKPCLYYFIKLCPAPCVGKISQNDYAKTIQKIRQILLGKDKKIIKELKDQMYQVSKIRSFEKAAEIRDQWQALEHIYGRSLSIQGDEDVFSIAKADSFAAVHIFVIRDQKMIRSETLLFDQAKDFPDGDILQIAMLDFYEHALNLPKIIVAPNFPSNSDLVNQWLRSKATNLELPVPKIIQPKRGAKLSLLKTGVRNALEKIHWHKLSHDLIQQKSAQTIIDFQKILSLPEIPRRIECYDISNIQGTSAVGSMVVFENGRPKKSDYRRFIIKTVVGANDPAMMQEVISRRLKHEEWPKPDLLLLDGGLPQLSIVSRLFQKNNIKIPLAALAKKEEEIYIPRKLQPIRLPKNSPTLQILQAIRDEAHRFAISFYRQRHRKKIFYQKNKDLSLYAKEKVLYTQFDR